VGKRRAGSTPGWDEADAETALYTWIENYVGMAIQNQKFAGRLQHEQMFGGKLKG